MSTLNFFNLNKKNTKGGTNAVEGVHYKVIKDGNNVEYRVLNFENTDICPRVGIIELEPLKSQRRHTNHAVFKRVRDREWDCIVGIPRDIDPKTKEIVWQRILVEERETLDLSIPADAMKWACIRRGPYFVDSPNFNSLSKTKYKALDREYEAVVFETQRRVRRKAIDIAEALVGEGLVDMAVNLGFDPHTMSQKTLWTEVVKFAESKPEEFMKVYDSDTRVELSVLRKALSMNIVTQKPDNGVMGYFYNGLALGYNEYEATKYLKEHQQTLASIDALTRQTEKQTEESMYVPRSLDPSEAEARIARLEKELAEKEAALKRVTESALDVVAEVTLKEVAPEFSDLMAEAKRLGIKGCHLIKDADKLRSKIEEKKREANN